MNQFNDMENTRLDSQAHEVETQNWEHVTVDGIDERGASKPYVGLEFHTHDEAYDFYNTYARMTGFGIRKGISWKNRKGETTTKFFVCNKEGFRNDNDKRN